MLERHSGRQPGSSGDPRRSDPLVGGHERAPAHPHARWCRADTGDRAARGGARAEQCRCHHGWRGGEAAAGRAEDQQHGHRPARDGDLARRRARQPALRRPGRSRAPNLDARRHNRALGRRDDLERDRLELRAAARVAPGAGRGHRRSGADRRVPRRRLLRVGGAWPDLRLHPCGRARGAAFGFAVTGDIATLSWRAAFVVLALPAFALAWLVFRLPEPARGTRQPLIAVKAQPRPPGAEPGDDRDQATDAQRFAREHGVEPDPDLILLGDPRRMGLIAVTRYVLRIRTNVMVILASAGGYFFLSGVQTFGVEFVTEQYGIDQALGTLVLLVVGAGGVVGVLAGGTLGDLLLHRGRLRGRIIVSAVTATAAVILFVPAI